MEDVANGLASSMGAPDHPRASGTRWSDLETAALRQILSTGLPEKPDSTFWVGVAGRLKLAGAALGGFPERTADAVVHRAIAIGSYVPYRRLGATSPRPAAAASPARQVPNRADRAQLSIDVPIVRREIARALRRAADELDGGTP